MSELAWPNNCASGKTLNDNVKVCWTVSVPVIDTDGDGLPDFWEVNGLDTDGDSFPDVDLPGMGASPLHKDLFLELDWMPGQEPQRRTIQDIKAAFAAAPVGAGGIANPDGLPGITLHVDTGTLIDPSADSEGGNSCNDGFDNDGNGVADADDPACMVGDNLLRLFPVVLGLGGGNQLPATNLRCMVEAPGFYALKRNNFDPRRAAVFRYGILAQSTPVCPGGGCSPTCALTTSGGRAEGGGNDFVVFNTNTAASIMHEFGHTLNLRHGGGDDDNCKPNYVSVMNYDHRPGIAQNGGGFILDYSPPRFAGGRGVAPLPPLVESNLSDGVVLDASDPSNMFVFVLPNGQKVRRALNRPVDWNNDGRTNTGLSINIDTSDARNGAPPGCTNTTINGVTDPLTGYDDWTNIVLSFRQFGDADDTALNPVLEREPTLEDIIQTERAFNTTDLRVTLVDTPDPVAAGEALTYAVEVENLGPNPTRSFRVELILPQGMSFTGASVPCVSGGGAVGCNLGWLPVGEKRQVQIDTLVPADLVFRNGGPLDITATARVVNVAGDDLSAANDQAATSTHVFAKADLAIAGQTALDAPPEMVIGTPVVITVRTTSTNDGPSAPMNATLALTAAATAGAGVSPASTVASEAALGLDEERIRDTQFTVTCGEPGVHTFTVAAQLSPTSPADVEADPTNNAKQLSFSIECVVPVKVNIHPGSFPNPLSLGSGGVAPLAVLTTTAGEYGLPLAFDATAIDPLSVRFGKRTPVFTGAGGAPENHSLGHVENAYEMDERTRDRDLDMVLHFATAQAGLSALDTEACVKGQFVAGGMRFKFFGCDGIVIVP